ncbi:MAG: hypothetical protein ABL962_19695, partial [Fimbriimonadaceae bacterium]
MEGPPDSTNKGPKHDIGEGADGHGRFCRLPSTSHYGRSHHNQTWSALQPPATPYVAFGSWSRENVSTRS